MSRVTGTACFGHEKSITVGFKPTYRNIDAVAPVSGRAHVNDYAFHWLNGLGKPQNSFIHHNAK